MCAVFWLFWLSCPYSPSDWPERLSLTVARVLSPQSPGQRMFITFGLMYCFVVLLCICVVPGPTWYISYSMTRYSLFVLKVPLNTSWPTNLWYHWFWDQDRCFKRAKSLLCLFDILQPISRPVADFLNLYVLVMLHINQSFVCLSSVLLYEWRTLYWFQSAIPEVR